MAVPFYPEPNDRPVAHFLQMQNLLRELLTLLRTMPSVVIRDQLNDNFSNFFSSGPRQLSATERDSIREHQVANSERALERRRNMRQRQLQYERQQQLEQQPEQQPPLQLLPDLVTSHNPPPPPQQLPAEQPSAADVDETKFDGAVKLQVAVCPACYYSKERKLKVIAIAKLDMNGKPIRWTCSNTDDEDEEPVVVENKSAKVKRQIMSLLQPAKIETSMLTAVFVIIGWKIFIRR